MDQREAPDFFGDLNLDQVVASVTATRDDYHLQPFFHAPLREVEAIIHRHEAYRDLEGKPLSDCISAFAQTMRSMRDCLVQAGKLRHRYQKESWFLHAVGIYAGAVIDLQRGLTSADVRSRGFLALREYLSTYVDSPEFTSLLAERKGVEDDLAGVSYCLHIQENRITVSRYDSQVDYAAEVNETFQKFKQGVAKDYRIEFRTYPDMNSVEAGVLDRVALLYPDVFLELDRYCERHRDFLDRTIADFDREVQFYVAYLEHVQRLTGAGLQFCYPRVSDKSKEVSARDTFDLALANKLIPEHSTVVRNDFALTDPERIFVVTGPNQGGKTTFARTFGQLHYLASLGCPVPGSDAQLFLPDMLFTHFEREEHLTNLRGKLEDELVRIHEILRLATPDSVLIMNEIFTSTTLRDALFLGTKALKRLIKLDLLCVCVTFVDELASLSETTVSVASTITPEDPTVRTYKIVRKPADGRAYAAAIAEKYALTYERLQQRIAR